MLAALTGLPAATELAVLVAVLSNPSLELNAPPKSIALAIVLVGLRTPKFPVPTLD